MSDPALDHVRELAQGLRVYANLNPTGPVMLLHDSADALDQLVELLAVIEKGAQ